MSLQEKTKKTMNHNGKEFSYYSLPELQKAGYNVRRLPLSLRIITESLLRNIDGVRVREEVDEKLLKTKIVDGMEPFDPKEPPWVVSGTFK